jgi:hypothetical protein
MLLISEQQYLKHKKLIESPFMTLYHEAAHAVACIRLRIKFSQVKIYSIKTKGYGSIRFNPQNWNFQNALINRHVDRIRRHIIMLMSGEFSEICFLASKGVDFSQQSDELIKISANFSRSDGRSDDEVIDELLKVIDLPLDTKRKLMEEASDLVVSNWGHIDNIATALGRNGTLRYFQIRKMMGA